ncbi:MAG: hypothetical protein ACRD3J_04860 [Thermoanaerobaculia bacterium]
MNVKRTIATLVAALLPLAASATTLVIPASGTGPGQNGSHWQTELTLHNTSVRTIQATLTFHDFLGANGTATVSIAPRATVAIADVVASRFGRESATGAIEIAFDSAFARKLTVNSRTFNSLANGEFGQDIPAVDPTSAPSAGDVIVLSGPTSVTDAHFNFGIYAINASTVRWELVRADGTVATAKEVTYASGTQAQYNIGVLTFLDAAPADNDTVHAVVSSGNAIAYGSIINEASGDPAYVPGVIARNDSRINFGIDFGAKGTIDVSDADHDGILDRSIDVQSGTWPIAFRVAVDSTTPATFELLNAPPELRFFDTNGGILWTPSGASSGTTLNLKIRVTADGATDIITIPVNIR